LDYAGLLIATKGQAGGFKVYGDQICVYPPDNVYAGRVPAGQRDRHRRRPGVVRVGQRLAARLPEETMSCWSVVGVPIAAI
jgi:hypothetical protein